jgi:hypothetical protein
MMIESTIIDDIWHWRRWPGMLAGIEPGAELEMAQVRTLVCGDARDIDVEHWVTTFIDYCERGAIAELRLRTDGRYVLALVDPLPTVEDAWLHADASRPSDDLKSSRG